MQQPTPFPQYVTIIISIFFTKGETMKRIIVATVAGFVLGWICVGFASGGGCQALPLPAMLQILASRTLIGFAIGISCLQLYHWSIHGLVMGAIFSVPLAFGGLMAPENPECSSCAILFCTILMGMLYGLLIEVVATVICKTKCCCEK